MRWILAFSKLLDDTYAVRRGYFLFTIWLTWNTFVWARDFANAHYDRPGLEIAAIIAAVGAVVGAIQRYAFKDYVENKP